jgi:hypothetical protein
MLNLFRRGGDLTPVCAVPDGGALPPFLHGEGWEFVGKVDDIGDQLLDADRATYEAVLRETGYYVFAPL